MLVDFALNQGRNTKFSDFIKTFTAEDGTYRDVRGVFDDIWNYLSEDIQNNLVKTYYNVNPFQAAESVTSKTFYGDL